MRALVTGAAGFVGRYLVGLLAQKGYQVCAADIHCQPDHPWGADVLEREVDVTQQTAMDDLLGEFVPDEVYHLAGIAAPTGSDHQSYYRVNFLGTLNLIEAVRKNAPRARILYVSSSNVYGAVPSDQQPICEDRFLRPIIITPPARPQARRRPAPMAWRDCRSSGHALLTIPAPGNQQSSSVRALPSWLPKSLAGFVRR